MNINYCKLVEDLMPLYFDKLTSDETNDFIKCHINQCSDCRKKYEKPCSEIPAVKFDVTYDVQEDKFISAKKLLLKVRKRIYLWRIIALLLILVVGAGSFLYGFTFNKDKPIKVKSAEDFANNVVPGWQRAEKSGQVVDLGISKPIPGTGAVVTFEKVWYTKSYTYVLYTVKEPNKKYLMAFSKDIDVPPDENIKNNPSMEPLGQRFGGISLEGYHQVMVFSGYNSPVPSNELSLTASNWRTPKILASSETPQAIDDKVTITLPLHDEFLSERSETIQLNKSYDWKGRILHLESLEVGSSKTLLYGELKLNQGETLQHINAVIKCGKQTTGLSYESITPGDKPGSCKFVFSGNPLNEWPGQISLEIASIEFKTSAVLNLPIDWWLYADKKNRVNVPEEKDAPVSFFDSTVRLWNIEPGKYINLEIVQPDKKQAANKPYITLATHIWIDPINNYATGVKVTNENGQILEIGGTSGGNIDGSDKIGIGIGIDNEDALWKSSRKLEIVITNPIVQLVVNEKIDIK